MFCRGNKLLGRDFGLMKKLALSLFQPVDFGHDIFTGSLMFGFE